jgi:hypothetical protein
MVGLPPDDEFWQRQRDQLRIPRIAPITDLVDALRQQRPCGVPYVAPMYGGVEARLLTVVTSPGRQTRAAPGGTGFLCIENPDRAAATVKRLMGEADINPRDMTPWNAYPLFTDAPRPTTTELEARVEPWVQLIRLLPDLRVMMLMGGDAQNGWRRVRRRYPDLLSETDFKIIRTYSPGPQAFRHPDPAERARRQEDLKTAFHQAAAYSKI